MELPPYPPPDKKDERWVDIETGDEYLWNGEGYWEGFNGLSIKYDPDKPDSWSCLMRAFERPHLKFYFFLRERAEAIDPELLPLLDQCLRENGCEFIDGKPVLTSSAHFHANQFLDAQEALRKEPQRKARKQHDVAPDQPARERIFSVYEQAWQLSDESGIPRHQFNEICRRIRGSHPYQLTDEQSWELYQEIETLVESKSK